VSFGQTLLGGNGQECLLDLARNPSIDTELECLPAKEFAFDVGDSAINENPFDKAGIFNHVWRGDNATSTIAALK